MFIGEDYIHSAEDLQAEGLVIVKQYYCDQTHQFIQGDEYIDGRLEDKYFELPEECKS